jgi:hypothetical protein
MDLKASFDRLCMPAQIYLLLALLACIMGLFSRISFTMIAGKLVFAVIWTMILNWICKQGYKGISWFLVLFPYIVILLAILGIMKRRR